jgi:hypothetical protein
MLQNDFLKVVNDLALESGAAWPLPIVLDIGTDITDEMEPGDRAGENLVEFLRRGLNVRSEVCREFPFEVVDNKIKQVFFV